VVAVVTGAKPLQWFIDMGETAEAVEDSFPRQAAQLFFCKMFDHLN
jgi:hypothetical protein